MSLVLSRRATADLARLRSFLAEHDPSSSIRALDTILMALRRLEDFPGLGRALGRTGLRDLIVPFGDSAYVVRYRHSASRGAILVLRIWHGRERRG